MSAKIINELLDIDGIKSSNKNLLDLFIRRTAVITSTQESIVEKIISDQWKQANKALSSETSISEVDICNIGVFYISPSKAKKRIKRFEALNEKMSEDVTNEKAPLYVTRNQDMIRAIKFKTKQLENAN